MKSKDKGMAMGGMSGAPAGAANKEAYKMKGMAMGGMTSKPRVSTPMAKADVMGAPAGAANKGSYGAPKPVKPKMAVKSMGMAKGGMSGAPAGAANKGAYAMGGNVTVKPAMPKPVPKGPMVSLGSKPMMAKGGMAKAKGMAKGGMSKKGKC